MKARILWLSVCACNLLSTASAYGALPKKPVGIAKPEIASWMTYAIAVVLVGVVCVAAFKSSNRSHLD